MQNAASAFGVLILVAQLVGWAVLQLAGLRFWAAQAWAPPPGPRSPFLRAVLRLGLGLLGTALCIGAFMLIPDQLDWVLGPLEDRLGDWASFLILLSPLLLGAAVTHSLMALHRHTSVRRGWLGCAAILAYGIAISVLARLISAIKADDLDEDPLIAFWLLVTFLPLIALALSGLHFGTTSGRTALSLYLTALLTWALRCLVITLYLAGTLRLSAEVATLLLVELCFISLSYLWSRRLRTTTTRAQPHRHAAAQRS